MKKMDKENGDNQSGGESKHNISSGSGGGLLSSSRDGSGNSGQPDPNALLDAASLFAYWGRGDQAAAAAAAAAASNPLFGSPFGAAGLGLLQGSGGGSSSGNDRYSLSSHQQHHNTMAVAASQAASLAGLHPASWWSMAQLAAQDYFTRLQASGLSQLPFSHHELAGAFPQSFMNAASGGSSSLSRNGGEKISKNTKKEKKLSSSNSGGNDGRGSGSGIGNSGSNTGYKHPSSSSGSSSAYKSSLYNSANFHKELLAMQAAAAAASGNMSSHQQSQSNLSSNKKSSSNSSNMLGSSSSKHHSNNSSNNSGNSLHSNQTSSHHNRSDLSTTSSKDIGMNKNNHTSISTSGTNTSTSLSSSQSAAAAAAQASMNALNSLSQIGNLNLTSQQSVTAAMNALAAGSTKAKDYMTSGILNAALEGNDPSSILGVRLPPDTEIIKYTSSIVGPKIPGTTNRGRKKTISLDPNPLMTGLHGLGGSGSGGNSNSNMGSIGGGSAAKRARLELDYSNLQNAHQNDRVEVIKLPPTITSNGAFNFSKINNNNNSSKDTLLNQDSNNQNNDWSGLNLSSKSTSSQNNANDSDIDAPLNLSLKSDTKNNNNNNNNISNNSNNINSNNTNEVSITSGSNSLQSLSSITAALGTGSGGDRISRRKPANKPRRLDQETSSCTSSSSTSTTSSTNLTNTLSSSNTPSNANQTTSNSNNNNNNNNNANLLNLSLLYNKLSESGLNDEQEYSSSSMHYKEGRPRNLGRGVSKPKKNTVASLLAQSRAVGIKPMLTTQHLLNQGADIEKIRQAISEANQNLDVSTDSESIAAESGMSESEGEGEQFNMNDLRLPLDKGWKRETIIRGLTKNGQIKGDVYYYGPGGSQNKLKNMTQIQSTLDGMSPSINLNRDNFSFSARAIVGSFLQPAPPPYANDSEFIRMSDIEVAKKLEELKIFTRHSTLGVEQRIEIARQQQAMRDAKKLAKEELARSKEKARQAKEIERTERLEQARKEREIKNQQAIEARRKRQEEIEKQKQEENQRKQQEKELKRQQAILAKEQMYLQDLNKQKELLYTVELERERRRQHMNFIKQLDLRRKYEEREKKKHQVILEKLITREKKIAARKRDADILIELRKPMEDSEICNQKELPELSRIPGQRLTGQGLSDLLMSFEFLNNFGETLGFDMESLPTMQSLHQALVCEDAVEAEEELLSVMTHLLVCAIEDPGIPNPARHTTLLGQSLRQADITNANVSEILRIYLYAVATGEVKNMAGVNFERDRDRRVADHHLSDADNMNNLSGKNSQYYEFLHENIRWKLSECLKEKPFVALNPSVKAQILAILCNDLLLNKAVVKQIEGSLESVAQLKKERYLLENKVRKYKSWHMRKTRMEIYERSQQLAMEKALALKLESATEANNLLNSQMIENELKTIDITQDSDLTTDNIHDNEKTSDSLIKTSLISNSVENLNNSETVEHKDDETLNSNDVTPIKITNTLELETQSNTSKKEQSFSFNDVSVTGNNSINNGTATPDINSLLSKTIISNNETPIDDGDISDLESECTMVDEDEDAKISAEEVQKKLEKVLKSSFHTNRLLDHSSQQLRATYYGQDRYWRRYWHLPKVGGIYVESMESAQPEIFKYHSILEEKITRDEDLQNIKNELKLSDHTQIMKYEADSEMEKMEEKCVQQSKDQVDMMMDIEDSIPTAVLVQKNNRPIKTEEVPNINTTEDNIENNDFSNVKNNEEMENHVAEHMDEDDDDVVEVKTELENGKILIAEEYKDVVTTQENSTTVVKQEIKQEIKTEHEGNIKIKTEEEQAMEKWFSIINREIQLSCNEYTACHSSQIAYSNITCEAILQVQGNRWDIGNNIQHFNIPLEINTNEIHFVNESHLSLSGLDEKMMENVLNGGNSSLLINNNNNNIDEDVEVKSEIKSEINDSEMNDNDSVINDSKNDFKNQQKQQDELFIFQPSINMSLLNLSSYIQCDSPSPLQMSQDEHKLLEQVKTNGVPEKLNKNYVSADLRHGWWKINDLETLHEVIQALHVRGVREKELRVNLLSAIADTLDLSTPNNIFNAQLGLPPKGYTEPEQMTSWNPQIAHRVEMSLLEQVESMEDKVASASMQIKGWLLPQREGDYDNSDEYIGLIGVLRERLLGLEAAIERRYLKPPLGIKRFSTAEAQLAAIASSQEPQKNIPETGPNSPQDESNDMDNIPKGLVSWREAVSRSHTSSQLAMALYVLESCVAWDKSIMKANCQFCHSGECEDKLLLCDGCDKGYHTYCFKPKMEKIPEGDWYCYECVNKATSDRKCIVCGGHRPPPVGKMIFCELCPRAYHHDCYIPPLIKVPRGKWYCHDCISKAPPPKKRPRKEKPEKMKTHNSSQSLNSSHDEMPPSPAHSVASTSCEDHQPIEQKSNTSNSTTPALNIPVASPNTTEICESSLDGLNIPNLNNQTITTPTPPPPAISAPVVVMPVQAPPSPNEQAQQAQQAQKLLNETKEKLKQEKKEKHTAKKLMKELSVCKIILEEMELHEDAWPFLLPVNTKQFPTYKKIIKVPMDLSTIKKRLLEITYKSRDDFIVDVRQIFDNCEVFNEDDSPVGKAGHGMRKFFEIRWAELTDKQS